MSWDAGCSYSFGSWDEGTVDFKELGHKFCDCNEFDCKCFRDLWLGIYKIKRDVGSFEVGHPCYCNFFSNFDCYFNNENAELFLGWTYNGNSMHCYWFYFIGGTFHRCIYIVSKFN